MQRLRVEFEDGGPLAYAILRGIPLTDGTVSEILECGPLALWRGYPVFTRTVVVGQKPIMFIQGKWRMTKAKVQSVEVVSARTHGGTEHERSGEGLAAGRGSVRRPNKRTGAGGKG